MKIILSTFTALLLLSLPLSACGVKPKSVDAPQGKDADAFPHRYPSK